MKIYLISRTSRNVYIFKELPTTPTRFGGDVRIIESETEPTQEEMESAFGAPIVSVPTEIASWRAKAILSIQGLTAQVEAIIDSMQDPDKTVALSAWNYGAPFVRNGPTVLAIASALNLSPSQIDEMFILAASLEA